MFEKLGQRYGNGFRSNIESIFSAVGVLIRGMKIKMEVVEVGSGSGVLIERFCIWTGIVTGQILVRYRGTPDLLFEFRRIGRSR